MPGIGDLLTNVAMRHNPVAGMLATLAKEAFDKNNEHTVSCDHWEDCPKNLFESHGVSNFTPEELACNGTGMLIVHIPTLQKLQSLRRRLGVPCIVNSAGRSEVHNKAVGGARDSQHLYGKAYDISMANHNPANFLKVARECGFRGTAYYKADNFVHIDTGPDRTWGNPAPNRQRFAPERVWRSSKAKSRTMQGSLLGMVGLTPEVLLGKLDLFPNWLTPDNLKIAAAAGLVLTVIGIFIVVRERSRKWSEGGEVMTLEDIGLGWLGVLGAVAAAFFSVWKVFSLARESGAKNQQVDDRVTRLEQARIVRDAKIDAIIKTLNEMKVESVKAHSDILQRLAVVETEIKGLKK